MAQLSEVRRRFDFVDAERGLIMLWVVVVHVAGGIEHAGIPIPVFFRWLMPYTLSFMMPLMFTLSGLFVESSVAKGPAEYARTRPGRLVYLFVVWTLVTGAVTVLGARFTNHEWSMSPLAWFLWAPVGSLWFLQALILSQVVYGALRFAGLGPPLVAMVGVAMTIGSAWLPSTAFAPCVMSVGFFALGPVLSGLFLERLPKTNKALLVGIAALGFAAHLALLRAGWPFWFSPFAAAVGAVATVCLGSAFGGARALGPLRALGAASLAIFVLHPIVAAPIRILLQRGLHVESAAVHLAVGIPCGLLVPGWAWHRWGKRVPWLFQGPPHAPWAAGSR